MSDNLSSEDRKKTMRAVKSRGTLPERQLWAMLAGLGVSGWRKNYKIAAGVPDVAFPEKKIAFFVDGCFWHKCPVCRRPLPQSNEEYWEKKLQRNVARDRRIDEELRAAGWEVVRIWEHDLKAPARAHVREKIRNALV